MTDKAGWSHSLTDFADQASEDITQKARVIAMAMLSEVVTRSPVGNPDLWEANKSAVYARETHNLFVGAYNADIQSNPSNYTKSGNLKRSAKLAREKSQRSLKTAFPLAAGKGYRGGTFRGSHLVSIGSPDLSITDRIDPSGSATISDGLTLINSSGQFPVIYIQTNSPYGEMLELGHSTQAPGGVYDLAFIGVSEAYK
ncbi:hypothetical protein [Pseudomonas kulmbachensis]|uniref:Uncharacterized protein n=1 Tax=Pseudomonas kulmbachensis TaxID=3043408 RepID=A0ABW7LT69_9PSED